MEPSISVSNESLNNDLMNESNNSNPSNNDEVLNKLQCPICYVYIAPPIRQCVVSHAICNQCYLKVDKCPICRQEKVDARCEELEKLYLETLIPCQYKEDGCIHKAKGCEVKAHEEVCEHRNIPCYFRYTDFCTWTGKEYRLFEHVSRCHDYPLHLLYRRLNNSMSSAGVMCTIDHLELLMPRYAIRGGDVILKCEHSVSPEQLYKVEWRKGDNKIFQYIKGRKPPFRYFTTPGAELNIAYCIPEMIRHFAARAQVNLPENIGSRIKCS